MLGEIVFHMGAIKHQRFKSIILKDERGVFLGFDMTIIKVKREILKSICKKYYEDSINDLPYEGIVEMENEVTTKCFESRLHLLNPFESKGHIGYASETYTEINPQLFIPIIKYCKSIIKGLHNNQRLCNEYKSLHNYMISLEFNIEEDIVLYKYDC